MPDLIMTTLSYLHEPLCGEHSLRSRLGCARYVVSEGGGHLDLEPSNIANAEPEEGGERLHGLDKNPKLTQIFLQWSSRTRS